MRVLVDCFIILQDHRKFPQRYYEFLDYFRAPDGPVFLKICGESSCNGISNDYLAVSTCIELIWFEWLEQLMFDRQMGVVVFFVCVGFS